MPCMKNLLYYVLLRQRLFGCFHTAFNMYAQATGLFHFTVTFTASSDSAPLLHAGAESVAISCHYTSGTKVHYWSGMFGWVQYICRRLHVEFRIHCFFSFIYFFPINSVEKYSNGYDTFWRFWDICVVADHSSGKADFCQFLILAFLRRIFFFFFYFGLYFQLFLSHHVCSRQSLLWLTFVV